MKLCKRKRTNAIKSTLMFVCLILFTNVVEAQVEYLRLSPAQTLTQRIGATDVTIKYSRPLIKGRTIFGKLVPFDKLWRTGANENTTINFGHRVRIGKTEVAAGEYTLWTKPMTDRWEVYLYTETNLLDVPDPIVEEKLIYLTTVKPSRTAQIEESLVINFYNVTEHTALLGISWEETQIRIPIDFYTHEAMEAMIEKEFNQNKFDFSIAAAYYMQRDLKLDKALKLQQMAIELSEQPSAWQYHELGNIFTKLKKVKEAEKAFRTSLKLAHESENDYLINENLKALEGAN